jgi:hypothetical protein
MDFDLLSETMRRLAIEAGEAIMTVYGAAELAVERKADQSPVTEPTSPRPHHQRRGCARPFRRCRS